MGSFSLARSCGSKPECGTYEMQIAICISINCIRLLISMKIMEIIARDFGTVVNSSQIELFQMRSSRFSSSFCKWYACHGVT
jgi:hypothetical protein